MFSFLRIILGSLVNFEMFSACDIDLIEQSDFRFDDDPIFTYEDTFQGNEM